MMLSASLCKHRVLILLFCLGTVSATLSARTLIEAGSGKESDAKVATGEKAVSARYRREFDASNLKADERLVILISASDGEVVFLNGREIGRVNMPEGAVDPSTPALAPLNEDQKGLFERLRVPSEAVRPNGKNVIETEVHSATKDGSPLSFDLALKTLPADQPAPEPDDQAKKVLEAFREKSYIAPETPIPDGYIDGGRHMKLDAGDHATSGREILLVDRPHDPELNKDLEYARSLRELPPLDRARKLALYVDQVMTPSGGAPVLEATVKELEHEFVNKPLRIGDVRDQYHAGVCRHRSLLFKVLGDEAGLKTALVRGNYVHIHSGGSGPHAWNEVQLEDGRRFLLDSMLRPKSEPLEITSPAVTSPETAKRYVKVDGSPFYGAAARQE